MTNVNIPEFIASLPPSGYNKIMLKDYLEHGRNRYERFAKRILANTYGELAAIYFRRLVVEPVRLTITD